MAEIKRIHRVIRKNSYPNNFIRATRRKMRSGNGENRGRERQEQPLVVLPYVKGVTEKITRVLKPHARVSTKPGQNLRSMLVKPKDKRNKIQSTGLVYQYECEFWKGVYRGNMSEHKV